MPIHTKKAAVRNREVSINNQIASIFVNNNGVVSINQNAIPKYESKTATTSLAISGTYRIPLVSSTSGLQGLNTSANLSYDTSTDTLQATNLTTTYLPQCSVVPTQPTQLVNKAYLDQYVGDYKQIRVYDDWLTGDVSGSLNWTIIVGAGGSVSVIPSEPGHAGIIRIIRHQVSTVYVKLNNNIQFTSNTIKSVRFLVRPLSINSVGINSVNLQLYLGPYSASPNGNNSASWSFYATTGFSINDSINWNCFVNTPNNSTPQASYNGGTLGTKWVLFEIEINDQKPSFYITVMGETNRILVYKELINRIDSRVSIQPAILFNRIGGSNGGSPKLDIDYIDILYNKL